MHLWVEGFFEGPLVLIGFEAYENLTLSRARPWVRAYKWPILFFVAVATRRHGKTTAEDPPVLAR